MPSITRADSRADQKTRPVVRLLRALALALVAGMSVPADANGPVRAITYGTVPQDSKYQSFMVFVDHGTPWFTPPEEAARQIRTRPAGSRALMLRFFVEDMTRHPLDNCMAPDGKGGWVRTRFASPWMTKGIARAKARLTAYLEAFKRAGGVADVVLFDVEENFSPWYVDAEHVGAIMADPRAKANLISVPGVRGLTSLERLLGKDAPNISYANPSFARWNAVMAGIVDAALNQAAYEPVRRLFPKAKVSNWQSAVLSEQNAIPHHGGTPLWAQSTGFGTHDSWAFYGCSTPLLRSAKLDGTNPVGDTAFAQLRNSVIGIRSLLSSSRRVQMPWIAHKQFGTTHTWGDWTVPFAGTDMWNEHVIQLVMHGCDTLLMFNPDPCGIPGPESEFNPVEDQREFESLLKDVNSRLGTGAGASIWLRKPEWNERVFATGRTVSGGVLWRFSFASDVDSVAVTTRDGGVHIIRRAENQAGAWFLASASNPIEMRDDGQSVAMVEVDDRLAAADLDGSGEIDQGDASLVSLANDSAGEQGEDLNGDGWVDAADRSYLEQLSGAVRDAARGSRDRTVPKLRLADVGRPGQASRQAMMAE